MKNKKIKLPICPFCNSEMSINEDTEWIEYEDDGYMESYPVTHFDWICQCTEEQLAENYYAHFDEEE